jgi:hypothetical protein
MIRKMEASVNARKFSALLFVVVTLVLGFAVILLAMNAGRADHAPQYYPDGVVIYGDWGLYRPAHVVPWAYGPAVVGAGRYAMGNYFPSNRQDPGAYRRRPPVDRVPVPADPYFRSWGAQSEPYDATKATVYAPFEPPVVIYAPKLGTHGHGKK